MEALEVGEAQRDTFNRYIRTSPKGHILQSYEWGEVKARTGWEPIRLLVRDGEEIKGAITILKRRLPGIHRAIFYAPRGPVLDFGERDTLAFLAGALREKAAAHGAVFLKIDPDIPVENREVVSTLRQLGFLPASRGLNFEGVQPRFVFRLPLERDLEEIMASFSHKTRYNIRLAERKGVMVRDGCRREDLAVFYRVLRETGERDRFLVRGYDYYEALWEHLVEKGYARLFMAEYQGEAIAGTLAFIFGDKAWYVYGASSNRHREVMPNHALQWAMIRWAREQGCRMYDFRGVSGDLDPSNPLYGLYRFKKGFGGRFTEFIGEFDLVFSPVVYRLWNWGEPAYRRLRSRLAGLRRLLHG